MYDVILTYFQLINTSKPARYYCLITAGTIKVISLYLHLRILIKISVKFVTKGPINDMLALVQIMAWCRKGVKPLSKPMATLLADASLGHDDARWTMYFTKFFSCLLKYSSRFTSYCQWPRIFIRLYCSTQFDVEHMALNQQTMGNGVMQGHLQYVPSDMHAFCASWCSTVGF